MVPINCVHRFQPPPNPKGPRTQVIGLQGLDTIHIMIFGPSNPITWIPGP